MGRRLNAVLLADMKDYSALMEEDEAHAIAGVDDIAAVFQRVVPRRGGRFEISSGDRFFAIFESAVEALEAAIEIQRDLAVIGSRGGRPLAIRIGIHLGEVVNTAFGPQGDSINIAARIQAIAEPGGISVSEDLYRAVRNRLTDVAFRDTGLQTLKNIRERIRVYAVVVSWRPVSPEADRVHGRLRSLLDWSIARRDLVIGGAALAAAGTGWVVWHRFPTGVGRITGRFGLPPLVPSAGQPLVLGVMAVSTRGEVPAWMSDFTRDSLNTVLSNQPSLLVFSKQKIDFLSEKRGLGEIEIAELLGIAKMVSASLSEVDSGLSLVVQIIDIKTGLIEGSQEVRGSEKQLIEMQNEAAVDVMRALKLPVNQADLQALLAKRTNDRLDDYKLLTESMGGGIESEPPMEEPRKEPHSALPRPWLALVTPRDAEASEVDEAAIRALLERYRVALESEDMAMVESLHIALPSPMRDALHRYFQSAAHLKVQFSKLDIVVEGDEALVTFTRSDDFLDAETGTPVHLEVRVSNVLARQDSGWKIRGLQKPPT
jgi:adenylate cyclase